MRKSILEKKQQISLLEPTKSRKIIAVDFIRKKKKFFIGLNPSFVTTNKLFWKTVKPFFSDMGIYGANIKLVKEKILQNESQIIEELNEFFKNAVSFLGITENSFIINEEYKNISAPV